MAETSRLLVATFLPNFVV